MTGLVLGFETANPHGYGRLITDSNGLLTRIIEDNNASEDEQRINFVNGGIMAVRCPLIFELLDQVKPNSKTGEIYLTDIIELANQNGHKVTFQIADEDVNVIAPFINDQNAPVSQNERFSLIRWGSQVDLVLPLDERYDFDLVLDNEMHINAGLDKLVKINFRNDPFQQHSKS